MMAKGRAMIGTVWSVFIDRWSGRLMVVVMAIIRTSEGRTSMPWQDQGKGNSYWEQGPDQRFEKVNTESRNVRHISK
jgi:hypothetical protein